MLSIAVVGDAGFGKLGIAAQAGWCAQSREPLVISPAVERPHADHEQNF